MDNSATKTQQNSSDQPSVQPSPVQNVGSSSVDAKLDKTQQPVVVNRGGIQVNLSTPQPKDPSVSQDDSSSTQSTSQQNANDSSQDESVSPQTVPAVQPDQKPKEPQAAPQPVSSPRSKEQEPVPAPLPDVAKMTDAEIVEEEKVVEKELEALVEKSPDTEKPDIPKEVKDAGVEHAKEDTPMPALSSGAVPLPMSYKEAEQVRNKNKYKWYFWRKSLTWFASLIIYHWKKINFKSKKED